jgi:hypothetical protein
MTTATLYPNAPDITADRYILLGLSTCFIREEGEVKPIQILEPIPSAALEALMKGIPTSFQMAYATTFGAVFDGDRITIPSVFPDGVQLCDDFEFRAISAARTYHARPEAQSHIPLGSSYEQFNYSLERKRVLNSERMVTAEDNVKQHSHTHKVL